MNSGIYTITNKKNGHRYVGSAVDLGARFRHHLHHLREGKHCNGHLQNAWNKYGEDAFLFEILEYWEPEFLISMEQWWMNMLCPEYNIVPVAGSSLGHKFSDEARSKLSVAAKRRSSSKEGYSHLSAAGKRRGFLTKKYRTGIFGLTPEQITSNAKKGYENSIGKLTNEQRMEIGNRKLTQSQVHEIRHLLALGDMSQEEIAGYYPVGQGQISRLKLGRTYADW